MDRPRQIPDGDGVETIVTATTRGLVSVTPRGDEEVVFLRAALRTAYALGRLREHEESKRMTAALGICVGVANG